MAVRAMKGWNPSPELSTLAANWQVAATDDAANIVQRELELVWKRWFDDLMPRKIGSVTKLLPNGHAGFIQSSDHEDFYFDARDWKGRRSAMAKGAQVTFATRQGFDRKRDRSTTVACDIRIALA
jgi:hypothetical protein